MAISTACAKIEWIVDVVRQCKAAGVACFMKQDSALRDGQQGRIPDEIWAVRAAPLPGRHVIFDLRGTVRTDALCGRRPSQGSHGEARSDRESSLPKKNEPFSQEQE